MLHHHLIRILLHRHKHLKQRSPWKHFPVFLCQKPQVPVLLRWPAVTKTSSSTFSFGPEFVGWAKTFYKNIQSCIINNGTISDFITLERGVRQGDHLWPYLFVLVAEALTIAVRQNITMPGITIGKVETKLLQCADALSDINPLQALLDLLQKCIRSKY